MLFKLSNLNFKNLKKYFIEEKYIIILSLILLILLIIEPLSKSIIPIYLSIMAILVFREINIIKEEFLVICIIPLTYLISNLKPPLFVNTSFGIFSILFCMWIMFGSKNNQITVKKFIKILFSTLFTLMSLEYLLFLIGILLNFTLESLFNIEVLSKELRYIFISIQGIVFTYFYKSFKVNVIEKQEENTNSVNNTANDEDSKVNKIFFRILDIENLGVIIIIAYIIKILITNTFPTNTLGRIIPIFFSIAILKLFFIEKYNKLKLEKIIWYLSPIFLYYYFNAIYKRVESHGLTEFRYVMIFFGIFLFFTSVFYFSIKKENKKLLAILFSGFLLLNFTINSEKHMVKKFEKESRIDDKSNKKKQHTIKYLYYSGRFILEKKSKLYFLSTVSYSKDNIYIREEGYREVLIKVNGNTFFKTDISIDEYASEEEKKENKKMRELLKNSKNIKFILGDKEVNYEEFKKDAVKSLENRINDSQDIITSNKAAFKITINDKIILIPIEKIQVDLTSNEILRINVEQVVIISE